MHLGGLNPLMRCHEQRKVRNLTARFKASTPLRLPHLHMLRSVYQEGAVAASNSRWWKEHRRIHTNLAGISSVWAWKEVKWYDMNCMLVLVFYTSIQAFTLIRPDVSKRGRSGRLFLVYMLGIGLTTSGDGFWVISHWQDSDKAKSFGAYVLVVTGPSNIKCRNVKLEFLVAAQLRKLFAPYHVRKRKCLPKASGS